MKNPLTAVAPLTSWVRRPHFSMHHDWLVLMWIAAMHVGALFAFFTFSWAALGVCLLLWWLTGGLGICLGYHRLFTHHSYETPRVVRYVLAVLGAMAGESGPIAWVAAHRYHHINSDTDKDPHSPLRGFLWAHVSWLFAREEFLHDFKSYTKYAPDLAEDRFIVFVDRYHILLAFALAGVLYLAGGWAFVVWGMFVRSVFVYHSTWLVNSASHIWGYQSYKTKDLSRNNWWVAILTFGEGWHNNHHAYQRSARHGFRWWEFDLTYWTVRALSAVGLARCVHVPVESPALGATSPLESLRGRYVPPSGKTFSAE